jgi:hypothetical protein
LIGVGFPGDGLIGVGGAAVEALTLIGVSTTARFAGAGVSGGTTADDGTGRSIAAGACGRASAG